MTALAAERPIIIVGKIKTFGQFGPKYEIQELLRPLDNGDWMVRIRLVESGEETEYRYSRMQGDPEAR